MTKVNKYVICAVIASSIFAGALKSVLAEEGETWQVGGLSTNSVSGTTAEMQKYWAYLATGLGAFDSTIALTTHAHTLNEDAFGIALDAVLLNDAKHRKGQLSEEIPELEAAVRNLGTPEDLEGECAGDDSGSCNEVNAKLNETELYISTLKNVGLEALEDIAGSVLIEPEDLIGAAPYIQQGFGSTTIETKTKVAGEEVTEARTLTEDETQKIGTRRLGHLQLTGTAGVARADLGTTVAVASQKQNDSLASHIGSGNGVIANIKILAGLDLALAQRLNLLNMIYGQQAANEAAIELQHLEVK